MLRNPLKVTKSLNPFWRKFVGLVTNQFFIKLTLIGNSIIILFSLIFYQLEIGSNPKIHHHIDAIWWSFATATTVGYGDITPVTTNGRILGIMLMLTGTSLFATFTAFFAQYFLGKEEEQIHKSIDQLNQKIDHLNKILIQQNNNRDKT